MEHAVVVLDGDDTIWFVEHLYDEARSKIGQLVQSAGFDAKRWEELERAIDLANVARMGMSARRFPTSCVEAYEAVTAELGDPDPELAARIFKAATEVFTRPAKVVLGAEDVIGALRRQFTVILLTKGEPWVQQRRILEAGLRSAFDEVDIVPDKGKREFVSVLNRFHAIPQLSWSVGNSLPSDINPALELGMNAIWIDAHVWEHERRATVPASGNLIVTSSLLDVPGIINTDPLHQKATSG